MYQWDSTRWRRTTNAHVPCKPAPVRSVQAKHQAKVGGVMQACLLLNGARLQQQKALSNLQRCQTAGFCRHSNLYRFKQVGDSCFHPRFENISASAGLEVAWGYHFETLAKRIQRSLQSEECLQQSCNWRVDRSGRCQPFT